MAQKLPIAVLISGGGSNLQAIIDSQKAGLLDVDIRVVVSNKHDAFGIERAKEAGIPTEVFGLHDYRTANPQASREDFDAALSDVIAQYKPELVVLAGWMLILGSRFLDKFPNRVINLHPSILPSFPGAHGVEHALDYGVRVTGCTIHIVDTGVDTGPIILQAVVPIEHHDTVESLHRKINKEEHKLYPQAIQLFAENRIKLDGRKTIILDKDEVQ
jgi:phosphoribosylglycinamide formyltransferase-1